MKSQNAFSRARHDREESFLAMEHREKGATLVIQTGQLYQVLKDAIVVPHNGHEIHPSRTPRSFELKGGETLDQHKENIYVAQKRAHSATRTVHSPTYQNDINFGL